MAWHGTGPPCSCNKSLGAIAAEQMQCFLRWRCDAWPTPAKASAASSKLEGSEASTLQPSCRVAPCHAMPCHGSTCHAIFWHAMPCQITPEILSIYGTILGINKQETRNIQTNSKLNARIPLQCQKVMPKNILSETIVSLGIEDEPLREVCCCVPRAAFWIFLFSNPKGG